MEKNSYYFYCDEKVTVWQRTSFRIQAESEESAINFLKKHRNERAFDVAEAIDDENIDVCVSYTETLYDTEELITPNENGGAPTIEWMRNGEESVILVSNSKDGGNE